MYLKPSWLWVWLVALVMSGALSPVSAGMLGYPAARLQSWHFRLEVAGDSFEEDLQNGTSPRARTGRALATLAFGLTSWSEIYARVGVAEFSIDDRLFNGKLGPAFGGGVRFRLLSFPVGAIGISGQYLFFTSNDDDSAGEPVDGEWQEADAMIGFGTKRFGHFQFYTGAAFHYSDVRLENQVTEGGESLEADQPLRLVAGVNLYPLFDFPGGDFVINVEVRFVGEIPRFTVGAQYAF
jgi:hypothetical protein